MKKYINGDNLKKKNMKWTSNNKKVVEIFDYEPWRISIDRMGTAIVSVKFKDSGQVLKWKFISKKDDYYGCSMKNGKSTYKVVPGIPESFAWNLRGIKGYNKIKWKVSGSDIADVDLKKFVISGKKAGTVKIKGKKDDITYTLSIKVDNPPSTLKDAADSWRNKYSIKDADVFTEGSPSGDPNKYIVGYKSYGYENGQYGYYGCTLTVIKNADGSYSFSNLEGVFHNEY